MCTAITYKHYFGRNLDLEYSYDESVTITPRFFPFLFRNADVITQHYALIGVAITEENYPLYYDATNEKGLSMAGLNFPGNAIYQPAVNSRHNIAPFELIPWVLSQCANTNEAESLLVNTNIADIPFSKQFPNTPLHWLVADADRSIVVEPLAEGLQIHKNPVGVLTNNPTFDYHMQNLANFLNLTSQCPTNRFSSDLDLKPYSRGMGAIGMPGDLSSASRFVRAAFTKLNSISNAQDDISQFFHILGSVEQQCGCVRLGEEYEKTIYSSCCDIRNGIYYYTTYTNHQISKVDMRRTDLDSKILTSDPLRSQESICQQN